MVQSGEPYVAAPPPAYAPPGQQPEITPAAPAEQSTEHSTEKTAAPQQSGPAIPAANGQPQPAPQQPRMVIPLEKLGDQPGDVDCPYCQKATRTRVQEEDSTQTYVIGLILGIFCICLACVPCCAGMAQDVDHYCSECGGRLTHRPYSNGQVQVVATPRGGQVSGASAAVPSKY